jgi:hypothetical protein
VSIRVYVDTTKTRLRFDKLPADALDALEEAAQDLDSQLLSKAEGLASGAVLQVRSGKYVAALKGSVKRSKSGVYGKLYSRDPRAALFEYGGKTGPHPIDPKNAHALLLQVSGGKFAAHVQHRGGDYGRQQLGSGSRGKYSVIFAAYDTMRGEIFTRMYGAVYGAIEAGE